MSSQQMEISEALQQALAAQQAGKLQDAAQLYRAILQSQPKHPEANHKLAVLAVQAGKPEAGLPYFKAAIEVDPRCEQYWIDYADALMQMGKIDEAKAVLQQSKVFSLSKAGAAKSGMHTIQSSGINNNSEKMPSGQRQNQGRQALAKKMPKNKAKAINFIVGLFNSGNYSEAEKMSREFIRHHPKDVFGYKALGSILAQRKESEEAVRVFRKGLKLSYNEPDLYNSLANALKDLGNYEEAIVYYKKALVLKPNFSEAYYNLGVAVQELGKFDDAILYYKKSLEIKPDYAEAYNNIGILLQYLGKLDEAVACYRKAFELKPYYSEAYYNAGNVFQDSGKHDEAVIYYKRALGIQPNFFKAYNNLGVAYKELGRLDEAVVSYKRAVSLKPDYADAYNNLGITLQELGKVDESIEQYTRALRIKPDFVEAYNNMGTAFNELGKFDDAIVCYTKALKAKPDYAEAYFNILDIKQYQPDGLVLSELDKIIETSTYLGKEKMHAHFALGKLHERMRNDSKAFENFKLGHAFRYEINKGKGRVYNNDFMLNKLESFKKIFTQQFFIDRQNWGLSVDIPIFIVGFPRSGTSLVEQILSSHSAVFGAGELKDIAQLATNFIDLENCKLREDLLDSIDSNKTIEMASEYLERIKYISNNSRHVVDKMPTNFEHLWLISILFPKSIILHCTRSPEDTCLSCYFTNFMEHHEYIDDLVDLANHYKYYQKMMKLWKAILPARIHDISYEQLVSNPDNEIHALLPLCNLDFEAQCLEFYKTKRVVKTASSTQVREKMYTSSVEKWKRFEQFLGPLLDVLHNG